MPLQTVTLKPGIDREATPTLNSAGWSYGNQIRFRDGLPEKNGGWSHLTTTAIVGTSRAAFSWADLSGIPYLASGSEQRLEIFSGGTLTDITPLRATTNLAPAFTTTLGSATVKITDSGGHPSDGDWVDILVPVSIGGIVLQGLYLASGAAGNDYNVTAATVATAAAGPGGAVPSYAVTNGSADVAVTLNNHGLAVNDTYTNEVATTVHGVTFAAYTSYTVTSVPDVNTFHITAGAVGTSSGSGSENAGNARLQYLLPSGLASATLAQGFGQGLFGQGLFGESSPGVTYNPLRLWFLDQWGQDLIGNYTGSPIYVWIPPVAPGNVAIAIDGTNYPGATSPPTAVNASFMTMPQQILMALGVDPSGGGTQDPNLVRWCDVGDFTIWVATATNQAGSFRIPSGSKIINGISAPQFALIWTDVDLWQVSYIGFPLVFSFNKIAVGVDLLTPNAAALYESVVYWPSSNGFFKFDGNAVVPVKCPVWDVFFRNLDRTQKDKVFAAVNSWFNEITWWFPSESGSGEIDSFVRYNIREDLWDYSENLAAGFYRTAWVDEGPMGAPIGVDGSGILQQHEVALDADGSPMGEFIQSGFFSIADGNFFAFLDRFIPDFLLDGPTPSVSITVIVQDYPASPQSTYGPYMFDTTGPDYFVVRARGRVAALRIGASSVGTFWRLGALRILTSPAGRR